MSAFMLRLIWPLPSNNTNKVSCEIDTLIPLCCCFAATWLQRAAFPIRHTKLSGFQLKKKMLSGFPAKLCSDFSLNSLEKIHFFVFAVKLYIFIRAEYLKETAPCINVKSVEYPATDASTLAHVLMLAGCRWVFCSCRNQTRTRTSTMKVKIKQWNGVASWLWVANDENCGICRMPFNGCCPDCE